MAKKRKLKGKRPLKVLKHFYAKNERSQAKLAKLIKSRGG